MATATVFGKKISLKYDKNGSFSFNKFDMKATDEQLYALAEALNGFQTDPMERVVKVTTMVIY